MLTLTAGLL